MARSLTTKEKELKEVVGANVKRLRRSKHLSCTCQQKLDTKLKKLGIKIEYLYKIQ